VSRVGFFFAPEVAFGIETEMGSQMGSWIDFRGVKIRESLSR